MKYLLFVYCRKNGISRDSGLHAQCEANNDDEAIAKLRKDGEWLLCHYDEIHCTIVQKVEGEGDYSDKNRKVTKFSIFPQVRHDSGTNFCQFDGLQYDSGPNENGKVFKLDKDGKPIIKPDGYKRHRKFNTIY